MKNNKHPTAEIKLKIIKSFNNGNTTSELSEIFGYSIRAIQKWIKQNNEGKDFKRKDDPGSGRPSKLNEEDEKELIKILKKPASEYGFETDLWNTVRIKIICKKLLKKVLSKMAIWRFLKKFDYSFKKVQKQYYETDLNAQEEWKEKTLPRIKKDLREYRAILYFEDESNISLSPVMGKSWGPVKEKIVHKVTGNRGSISAISAISNDSRLVFNLFDGGKRFKSEDIIIFFEQLLSHHPGRHLVVIMDRATCHTSKKTKEFIKSKKRLHVYYLPAKSPQLNPDEQVWAHLKNHELKSHQETTLKGLKNLTRKKMNKISKDKNKIKGIFMRCDNAKIYL
jgi:transposase